VINILAKTFLFEPPVSTWLSADDLTAEQSRCCRPSWAAAGEFVSLPVGRLVPPATRGCDRG